MELLGLQASVSDSAATTNVGSPASGTATASSKSTTTSSAGPKNDCQSGGATFVTLMALAVLLVL